MLYSESDLGELRRLPPDTVPAPPYPPYRTLAPGAKTEAATQGQTMTRILGHPQLWAASTPTTVAFPDSILHPPSLPET